MSLLRTVYLGAILCGWTAFGGWFVAEILRQGVIQPDSAAAPNAPAAAPRFLGSRTLGLALASEKSQTIAAFCVVGAAIGAGLGLAGGLSNWQLGRQVLRMLRGFVAGGLGGVAGGWVGAMIYQVFATDDDGSGAGTRWWLRPVGWMAAGALVGLADGLFTLSRNRMRNGLIGGLVGGLIGGILFDPIKALVAHAAGAGDPALQFEITSRAAGFVAVGLFIGGAVGLTNLLLRHAWLTVLDGDRPGRQVILNESGLTLGSHPSAGLPFLRDLDRSLLPTQMRIVRGRDGSFTLLPASPFADGEVTVVRNGVRERYLLKDQSAKGISLENDCVINCGRNSIRFNERSHRSEVAEPSAAPRSVPPPLPAKKKEPGASPAVQRPISEWNEVKSAPVPMPHPKPPPAPAIAPPAVPPPLPQPQPSTRAENICPNGHRVPAGQRYCVVCDTFF
jgi:hypothetical protein